ncbi:hypothetical protein ABZ714_27155 [Streptomyces sp. NPDC006798]|uniref:hypothetical protein n=1 Tax=Streptomyces sp. NPDC006798 TaxID=3155462 RepID=UPI0033EF2634
MVRTSGTSRTAGAWAPLLLLVLALGVFAMHTVGHPEADAPVATAGPAYGVAAPAPGDTPAGHGGGPAAALADPDPDRSSGGHGGHGDPGDSGAGMAMDMLALCVAVLGTALLAALLRAALGRRPDWLVRLRTGALLVTRRGPPPRAPDLASLSILRI